MSCREAFIRGGVEALRQAAELLESRVSIYRQAGSIEKTIAAQVGASNIRSMADEWEGGSA